MVETVWGGDVVVVGGGVSGLWIRRELIRRGYSVSLVEREALLAGQSSHSHGYLHRGFIYLSAPKTLTDELQAGADMWEAAVDSVGGTYEASESLVVFEDQASAQRARDRWPEVGLDNVGRLTEPDEGEDLARTRGLRPNLGRIAVSAERVISVDTMAKALDLAHDWEGMVLGTVVSIGTQGRRVSHVDVELEREVVRIAATHFIFCNGADSVALIRQNLGLPGWLSLRQSYMLVLRGKDLPSCSAVFPGSSRRGLFMGSRKSDADGVWLISDFVSFAGSDMGPTTARLWLRSLLKSAMQVFPVVDAGDDVAWSYYPAPKVEFRKTTALEGPQLESYGLANARVALPTKLTLAPVLAGLTADWIDDVSTTRGSRIGLERWPGSKLKVHPELWESCKWYALERLDDVLNGAPPPDWQLS